MSIETETKVALRALEHIIHDGEEFFVNDVLHVLERAAKQLIDAGAAEPVDDKPEPPDGDKPDAPDDDKPDKPGKPGKKASSKGK